MNFTSRIQDLSLPEVRILGELIVEDLLSLDELEKATLFAHVGTREQLVESLVYCWYMATCRTERNR